jgi:hypothetical protein
LLGQITSSSEGILESLVADEIIADWQNVAVSQDPDEPRKVLCYGQVQPAFGMQWMDVTFTFVLSFT